MGTQREPKGSDIKRREGEITGMITWEISKEDAQVISKIVKRQRILGSDKVEIRDAEGEIAQGKYGTINHNCSSKENIGMQT